MANKARPSKLMRSIFEIEEYLRERMQETKQKTFGYRYGDYVKRRDNFNKVLSHLIKHPNHPSKAGNFVADQVAIFAKGFTTTRNIYQMNLAGLHSSLEKSQISKEDHKTLVKLKKLGELRLELRLEQKRFGNKDVSEKYLTKLREYQQIRKSLQDDKKFTPSINKIIEADFTEKKAYMVKQAYKNHLSYARNSKLTLDYVARVIESTKKYEGADWEKASADNPIGETYSHGGSGKSTWRQATAEKGSLFQKKQLVENAIEHFSKHASKVDKKKFILLLHKKKTPIARYIRNNLPEELPRSKVTLSR